MNTKLYGLLIHGFFRRRKEIMRACIATFLAIFFISGVLLFQENMYQWQMAQNRRQFGDWFVIEDYQQTAGIKENAYLTEAATAKTYAMIYDKYWNKSQVNVGTMTDEFMEKGNIYLVSGHLPTDTMDIAMDYNTLSKLGYSSDLGQEITFNYYLNDNSSSSMDSRRSVTYTLCGVFNNFTDSWSVMRYIPGAVVSDKGSMQLQAKGNAVYMYGLKDEYRWDDYAHLYDQLSSYNSKKVFFNKDVYDFQPWGPKDIYNYIYMLVMVIGVVALTYQIISYQHSRTEHYKKLYRLGTTRQTIFSCRTLENILILIPSGALGILGAFLTGKILGGALENKYHVMFYHINAEVLLKSIVSLLMSLLVAEVVNVVMSYLGNKLNSNNGAKKKTKRHKPEKEYVSKLSYNNVTWQMHVRLSKSNGIAMRLGVRVFLLGIAAVILFCLINIVDAVSVYKEYASKSDICGFQQQEGTAQNYLNFTFDTSQEVNNVYTKGTFDYYMQYLRPTFTMDEYMEFQRTLGEGERNKTITSIKDLEKGIVDIGLADNYLKMGNSTIIEGLDDTFIDTLNTTAGIESASYSSFETARDWEWDNMDLSKMGVTKMKAEGSKMPGYSDTYLFATEYVDPTQEIYSRISEYIDPSVLDYDAFKEGRQIVIFEQKNPNQVYDNTIQVGTDIRFHYYQLPIAMNYVDYQNYNIDLQKYIDSPFPYWNQFLINYYKKNALFTTRFDFMNQGFFYTYYPGTETETSDRLVENYYKMRYEPCASAKVAAVVKVSDEVKEALSDIIPDFGYYTAIASSELGKQECEKQNGLMERMLGEDYSDDYKYEYSYNQVTLTYNLSASYSATDNIISAYFKANNVIYQSSASHKEGYRTSALNAILQYGVTMIAAIVINILIYSILTKNRLELRRKKLKLLASLGTQKSQICRICMLEIIRESLWCIFTAPLLLLVQYVICRGSIRRL